MSTFSSRILSVENEWQTKFDRLRRSDLIDCPTIFNKNVFRAIIVTSVVIARIGSTK